MKGLDMIGEFAFTPSVFEEAAHLDIGLWREQLRELGSSMFPRTAPWPVMVANLYGGSWASIASKTANAIENDKARKLSQDILENISKTLVRRPVALEKWPEEDLDWVREAIATDQIEPIDRIVSCMAVRDALKREGKSVRCIDEVQGGGFWTGISSQWSQPMKIQSQIKAIRKIVVHAEFLCLITPYVQGLGGGGDETEFTKDMIRDAFVRPIGFSPLELEVHSEGADREHTSDFAQRLSNLAHTTSDSLRRALRVGQSIRLILWPKLLDRYLIAGVYTESSGGQRLRSPRWGIAMQHIARSSDNQETKPPTSWSLMDRTQLGDVFSRYCSNPPSQPLYNALVTGS